MHYVTRGNGDTNRGTTRTQALSTHRGRRLACGTSAVGPPPASGGPRSTARSSRHSPTAPATGGACGGQRTARPSPTGRFHDSVAPMAWRAEANASVAIAMEGTPPGSTTRQGGRMSGPWWQPRSVQSADAAARPHAGASVTRATSRPGAGPDPAGGRRIRRCRDGRLPAPAVCARREPPFVGQADGRHRMLVTGPQCPNNPVKPITIRYSATM